HGGFAEYEPRPLAIDPQSTMYYGPGSNPAFREADFPPPPDVDMVRAIALLARAHGTRVVFLDVPGIRTASEHLESTVEVFGLPPELYQPGVTRIGVPNAVLYKGLSVGEIQRLYNDRRHYNKNGARYFTSIIAPALVMAYEHGDRR